MAERRSALGDAAGDGCAATRARAEAFVLEDLDGIERAEVVDHLAGCPRCRAEVAALASTVDAISGALPEPVEPSPGFVDRVVGGGPAADVMEAPPVRRIRPWRTRPALVAAAVAAALAVGISVGVATSGPHPSRPTAARAVVVTDLRTADGGGVGQAVVEGTADAHVSVGFDLADSPDPTAYDGRYVVLAVLRDGQRVTLGSVAVTDGRGGLQAVTSVPTVDIATIKVQSPSGRSLCAGLLGAPGGPPPGPPPG